MSNSKDKLFELIKSLTKAEKKGFKVFATRLGSTDTKFVTLFDVLDKATEYSDAHIFKKAPSISKAQLSNVKAHLYKQLLVSLRLTHINGNLDIQLREQLDFARILYNKGLFNQALRLLGKAKIAAKNAQFQDLALEILQFEKIIEAQFITRSLENRADLLIEESHDLINGLSNHHELSNLSLKLYSIYVKTGHVANRKDYQYIREIFESRINRIQPDALTFYEKLHYFVACGWYGYIIQDFKLYYKNARLWVNLFNDSPHMKKQEPLWYMKALHNLSESLYITGALVRFEEARVELMAFVNEQKDDWEENLRVYAFIYESTAEINHHFLTGRFTEGTKRIPTFEKKLNRHQAHMDNHRVLVFQYKLACLYFGSGDFKNCISKLNEIINNKDVHLREDIHCFARILNLIAHFELGNDDLLEHQIRNVYRFLIKMDDLNLVQKEILEFLKNLQKTPASQLNQSFEKLRTTLLQIRQDPYEKRPFLYLDIISWLESKLNNQLVENIIQAKYSRKELRW